VHKRVMAVADACVRSLSSSRPPESDSGSPRTDGVPAAGIASGDVTPPNLPVLLVCPGIHSRLSTHPKKYVKQREVSPATSWSVGGTSFTSSQPTCCANGPIMLAGVRENVCRERGDTSRETANGTEKDKKQLRGIGRTAAMSTASKSAAGRGAISRGGAGKWVLAALAVLSSGVEQSVVAADKLAPPAAPRVERPFDAADGERPPTPPRSRGAGPSAAPLPRGLERCIALLRRGVALVDSEAY